MLPKTESACFVIADISGYTSFLAGVELDHAHDIIADVMDTVVRCLRPPFRLAKFEGDAAFFYAVTDKVDGSLLQDAIESAYFAFRKRLRNIKQSTSCECSACSRMQDLDVKFVSHHGEFIRQKMAGREQLAGRDGKEATPAVLKFCSMLPAFEFQARPVVPVMDAVRVELEAIAFRDGLKSN